MGNRGYVVDAKDLLRGFILGFSGGNRVKRKFITTFAEFEGEISIGAIAARHDVPVSTAHRWVGKWREARDAAQED